METFLIKALQLILSLSILVFVHELGHFTWARIFKVRVEKFYLFFNPQFSILRAKKINGKWQFSWFSKNLPDHVKPVMDAFGNEKKDKKGRTIYAPAPLDELEDGDWRKYPGTEWGIGWVPLGGYCRIAGMVDETQSVADMNSAPKPWEYRAQKAWKRLLIITGGVINNFLSAILIYAMILFFYGEQQLPVKNAYLGYDYCQTALDNGFQNGDIIETINDVPAKYHQDVLNKIILDGDRRIVVDRNGKDTLLVLPKNFGERMLEAQEKSFMQIRYPFVIDKIDKNSPAATIPLQRGDSVVGLAGKRLFTFMSITKELSELKDKRVDLEWVRNGNLMSDSVTISRDGKLGVMIMNAPQRYFKFDVKSFGFLASFPAGIKLGFSTLGGYIKQFKLIFTKAGAKSVGGFGAIGNLFPASWDWLIFWQMTAFLSVALAFMNILPIPALDGGYLLFIIVEMITGKKPSDRFMETALNFGILLLLALFIFANGNDLLRLFR